jgi:hypothetical protein
LIINDIDVKKIILVVQGCGSRKLDKYRLGIRVKESTELFKYRGEIVSVQIPNYHTSIVKTTCGPPKEVEPGKKYKKGYDLYSKDISDWIIDNKFHNYKYREPTELEFYYSLLDKTHHLKFIRSTRR